MILTNDDKVKQHQLDGRTITTRLVRPNPEIWAAVPKRLRDRYYCLYIESECGGRVLPVFSVTIPMSVCGGEGCNRLNKEVAKAHAEAAMQANRILGIRSDIMDLPEATPLTEGSDEERT